MRKLYITLKYLFISLWSIFVVAPFLWALSTSFKDFNSVTGGATYIPWVDFEPSLEGWKVLLRSPAQGGVNIVEPYFNSIAVTCSASFISIFLGTLAAYALSRFTFKAGFIKNSDITFFFISQRIMPPIVLSIPFFIMFIYLNIIFIRKFLNYFFKNKYIISDYKISLLSCIYISVFPFVPSGNIFNNWMSVIYFLPIGFLFLNEKNYVNQNL